MQPLVGNSPAILRVLDLIERAAKVDSPVLISGEEGTGKRTVAEMIHRQSRRANGPFVVVHTERVPRSALESSLFGDPSQRNGSSPPSAAVGDLAAAHRGTLVIDEITGLPRTGQAKLLAAAERPFSSDWRHHPEDSDFRLMATTRYKVSESVARGRVREDLYYRLAVVTIHVPPLRLRRQDIPALVGQILGEVCGASDQTVPTVEPELMSYLMNHPWPGNVGQLRRCLETMLIEAAGGMLGMRQLRTLSQHDVNLSDPSSGQWVDSLAELERAAVMRALKIYDGNRTKAAKALGVSVRTLQRKLRQWSM